MTHIRARCRPPRSVLVADPESQKLDLGSALMNSLLLGALWLVFGPSLSGSKEGGGRTSEISFQEFRNQLLANGLVTRLEVANGSVVKVGSGG
jgi:hypothetical protein